MNGVISLADDTQYFIKAGWKPAVRIAGFQPALSLNQMSCVFGIIHCVLMRKG
jgi:hypothetical protein